MDAILPYLPYLVAACVGATLLGFLVLAILFLRSSNADSAGMSGADERDAPMVRRGHAVVGGCFAVAGLVAVVVLFAHPRAAGWPEDSWQALRDRLAGLEQAVPRLAKQIGGLAGQIQSRLPSAPEIHLPWVSRDRRVGTDGRAAPGRATDGPAAGTADASAMPSASPGESVRALSGHGASAMPPGHIGPRADTGGQDRLPGGHLPTADVGKDVASLVPEPVPPRQTLPRTSAPQSPTGTGTSANSEVAPTTRRSAGDLSVTTSSASAPGSSAPASHPSSSPTTADPDPAPPPPRAVVGPPDPPDDFKLTPPHVPDHAGTPRNPGTDKEAEKEAEKDAREAEKQAREEAREIAKAARDAAKDAREEAREAASAAREAAKRAREDAREAAKEARDAAKASREEVREAAKHARDAGKGDDDAGKLASEARPLTTSGEVVGQTTKNAKPLATSSEGIGKTTKESYGVVTRGEDTGTDTAGSKGPGPGNHASVVAPQARPEAAQSGGVAPTAPPVPADPGRRPSLLDRLTGLDQPERWGWERRGDRVVPKVSSLDAAPGRSSIGDGAAAPTVVGGALHGDRHVDVERGFGRGRLEGAEGHGRGPDRPGAPFPAAPLTVDRPSLPADRPALGGLGGPGGGRGGPAGPITPAAPAGGLGPIVDRPTAGFSSGPGGADRFERAERGGRGRGEGGRGRGRGRR